MQFTGNTELQMGAEDTYLPVRAIFYIYFGANCGFDSFEWAVVMAVA